MPMLKPKDPLEAALTGARIIEPDLFSHPR